MAEGVKTIQFLVCCALCIIVVWCSPFDWMKPDNFDVIQAKMMAVNADNCMSKPAAALYLPEETVTQKPLSNRLLTYTIYPNRTSLLLLHNLALQRAFFFSLLNYKTQLEWEWPLQPGLMYHYMSALADVAANNGFVNQSAFYYDTHMSYANWYSQTGLPLNQTLKLFAPVAWRMEDYTDPSNWLREPTNFTFHVTDAGAGPESNYAHPSFKLKEFYDLFSLPDLTTARDSIRKSTYTASIKYSNITGQYVKENFIDTIFAGPPAPGIKETTYLPVLWTRAFFDCGKSNKWVISAVAPVMDYLYRYHKFDNIRGPKYIGVITESIDFLRIDFNPCPVGDGNPGPSYLANTARCKETTICEPLHHWGFVRGGYQCVCKPGYRYPKFQRGPFQGLDIERSTYEEYQHGFDCLSVGLRYVIPQQQTDGITTNNTVITGRKRRSTAYDSPSQSFFDTIRSSFHSMVRRDTATEKSGRIKRTLVAKHPFVKRYAPERKSQKLIAKHPHSRKKRSIAFDQRNFERMIYIFQKKEGINGQNCRNYKDRPHELELPGDVSYGIEGQFAHQALTAVRLANFISNFLQNVNPQEQQGNIQADQYLHFDQLFSEVISNVMGDPKMEGSGVFFDQDKYPRHQWDISRRFFGPYAFRNADAKRFSALDLAGNPDSYLTKSWFKNIKMRWIANTYGLRRFVTRPHVRTDIQGSQIKKNARFPFFYRAAQYKHGEWTPPYFDCDGFTQKWILTFSVPFFGFNSLRTGLEFKGVVTVDLRMDNIDINQCPQEYHVANAFKNTARCDYETTYCEAVPGKKFDRGGYKCECRQGFEYAFKDSAWFFDGDTMENEYKKKIEGKYSRYDSLKCRIAGASSVKGNWLFLVLLSAILLTLR